MFLRTTVTFPLTIVHGITYAEHTGTDSRLTIETRHALLHRLRLPLKLPERGPSPAGDNDFLSLTSRISESLLLTGFARASAAALALITSTFFLLCSFSFSYYNIVRNVNARWVYQTAQSYAWAYWLVILLNAVTLLPAFRHRASRLATEALLIALAAIGMLMTRVYRLTDLPLDPHNIAWSIALTLPLLCFGVHDIAVFSRPDLWKRQPRDASLPLHFAFLGGAVVGLWYFLIAWVRYPASPIHRAPILATLALTLILHGCAFACLAASCSACAT